jgi:DnaJ-class molecular chaperone|tara:strand:- start:360 stop:524 length:165 start_codon:yes stop_codon:yes gene_type:complete
MSDDWPYKEADCSECDGRGSLADRNPNDPAMQLVPCDICDGAGFLLQDKDVFDD